MSNIEVNGKRVYYEVHGVGEPLILLNGIMMSTASWHMFLSDFKEYQLILIDFLDQGQSDSMTETYTHQVQVEVVEAIVSKLGIHSIHLVGISYGAEIALEFALSHQELLKTLIIFNGAAKTSLWLRDIGIAWQLAARTYDSELFYHVAIPYVYSSDFYSSNEEWFDSRKKILLKVFNAAFLNRLDRLIESSSYYDIVDKLAYISSRTIIIAGDNDFITPIGESRNLHQLIPNSELITLKDCGHASMYEQPNEFIRLIKQSISDDNC